MKYREALDYIETIQTSFGSDYSLRDVTELARRAGRPDRAVPVIHIAGTNGKGSVANALSAILVESGYSVGRYLSPTIFGYRERIQRCFLNEKDGWIYISEEETADCLSHLRKYCEEMKQEGFGQPTAFEIETVMAFLMFARWKVEIAVIETGMGGRLDATNIIEYPLQCIFTSISRDHMQQLGNTLEAIAREKYGIIKEGVQVVSASQPSLTDILKEICWQKKADLILVDNQDIQEKKKQKNGQSFFYQGTVYTMRQAGKYQAENAVLAMEAAKGLRKQGFDRITQSSVQAGISGCFWKGRFEVVSDNPFLLVDGAHNAEAAVRLRESLQWYYPGERFCFLFGFFKDKEYRKILVELLPLAQKVYAVTAPGSRGLDNKKLCDTVQELFLTDLADVFTDGRSVSVAAYRSVTEVLQEIWKEKPAKKTVVCGSLSILGEVYSYLC